MIEQIVLSNLALNERYSRKVLPFLQSEYFHSKAQRVVFEVMRDFINKYNELPTKKSLFVELGNIDKMSQADYDETQSIVQNLEIEEDTDLTWLTETTEKFCQDKALYNALMKSIEITNDDSGKLGKGSIPEILTDALAVSFDTSIGHDFFEDHLERFSFYHRKEDKIPFDLDYLNKITRGGLPKKSLNIILAGTGVGKSMMMCHMAANNLLDGKNVLYLTMEMAEQKIARRIETNLIDVPDEDIEKLTLDEYTVKIKRVWDKTSGKLVMKEYPPTTASANHIRTLLNELKIKKKFVPDIIYVDYLNICASARIRAGAGANSYTIVKAIAEELRGIAVEYNVPLVSATQTTRSGYTNSDLGLEDTSESFGLPQTADFMIAMIQTDDLHDLGQIMIKQLKNRYGDPNKYKKFVVGVDRSKMRLYDADQSAQDDMTDTGPIFDRTPSGEKFNMDKFKDFM